MDLAVPLLRLSSCFCRDTYGMKEVYVCFNIMRTQYGAMRLRVDQGINGSSPSLFFPFPFLFIARYLLPRGGNWLAAHASLHGRYS